MAILIMREAYFVGFHSLVNRRASAISAGVIRVATRSRHLTEISNRGVRCACGCGCNVEPHMSANIVLRHAVAVGVHQAEAELRAGVPLLVQPLKRSPRNAAGPVKAIRARNGNVVFGRALRSFPKATTVGAVPPNRGVQGRGPLCPLYVDFGHARTGTQHKLPANCSPVESRNCVRAHQSLVDRTHRTLRRPTTLPSHQRLISTRWRYSSTPRVPTSIA